ncbi:hypothetical protein, partial [Vibrio mimicus]|uniref:hypothetical protein n=2 Tax=Vibrio TaxID=662 RepID=UPI001CA33672
RRNMVVLFESEKSRQFFDEHFELLTKESDIGCVMLGVSAIDEIFNNFFLAILPKDANSKIQKRIFDSRGVFGELSSKLDVAYTCRFISRDLYESVHLLRKLRNKLAHKVVDFDLRDYIDDVHNIFSKINGDVLGVMMSATDEVLIKHVFQTISDITDHSDETKRLFSSEEDIREYVKSRPNLLEILVEKKVKIAFTYGVLILGALIINCQENALRKFA